MSATTIVPTARSGETGKIVSASEAVRLIRDGDIVATGGFAGIGFAEEVAVELANAFLATTGELASIGRPRNLALVFAAGQGDFATRGLNRLAVPGLIKRAIGGHFGATPKLAQLAVAGQIEAYNLLQGVISHLFRDIAAGKPGHLSRVGLAWEEYRTRSPEEERFVGQQWRKQQDRPK